MPKYVKKQEIKLSDEDLKKLETSIVNAIQESNKKATEEFSVTREWMKFLMCPVLWGVAALTGLLGIGFFIVAIRECNSVIPTMNSLNSDLIIKLIIEFMLGLFSICLAMLSFTTAIELDKEKDRAYIANIFSNMVSLAALIIALIALFDKG